MDLLDKMNYENLKTDDNQVINDLLIITPDIFEDDRGFFYESWNQRKFNEIINKNIIFLQDNHSRSRFGVLRGLHYQLDPNPQGKLVRCSYGSIFDVAVDLRRNSPTYGKWGGLELNSFNKKQLWIPEGFAHGFLTLSENAEVQYKATGFWNKDSERSLKWNDSRIDINWFKKIKVIHPKLTIKDSLAPTFNELEKSGDIFL